MSYNKTIIQGNLSRDIELRYTQSGTAVANTAIAASHKYTSQGGEKKEEAMFIDITFFGKSAETANQYLRKGSKVLIDGRLNFEQWSDQQGQKRSKHTVVVESFQMLDSKQDGQAQASQPQHNHPQGYAPPQQPQPSYGYQQPPQGYVPPKR